MMYAAFYDSPAGRLTLVSDGEALCGLWIEGQRYELGGLKELPPRRDELPVFLQTEEWLGRYFAGMRPSAAELPLNPAGSAFRKMIWRLLTEIPYGQVTTYRALAARAASAGRQTSARAVGGAVGHNPISIIIPCHRVIGSDGRLTGYAGGLDKKRFLLELEGVRVDME